MRLSVHHATRFDFDQPSGHSIHDVRLTPKPAAGQRIVSWRIDGPGKRSEWLDGHGNQVTTFSVAQQHDHVEIVVHGLYEYSGSEQWLRYAEVPTLPAPFWLRNSGLTRHDATFDPLIEGLAEVDLGGGGHAVLLAGAAARADRADDLAADHDQDTALGCDRRLRKGHERRIACGKLVRERFARTAKHDRGARLGPGDLARRRLGPIHLLEIDELARRPDDGERHPPIVLLGLGKGGGGHSLGLLIGDRRPIVGRRHRLLGQGRAAERQPRADAQRDHKTSSHVMPPLRLRAL